MSDYDILPTRNYKYGGTDKIDEMAPGYGEING